MPQKDFRKPAFPGLCVGIRLLAGVLLAVAISGCATLERLPAVTYAEARQLEILDIPDARFYVSDTNRIYDVAIKAYQRSNRVRPAQTRHFLALWRRRRWRVWSRPSGRMERARQSPPVRYGDRRQHGCAFGAVCLPGSRLRPKSHAALHGNKRQGHFYQAPDPDRRRRLGLARRQRAAAHNDRTLCRLENGPEAGGGIRQGPAVVRSDDEP